MNPAATDTVTLKYDQGQQTWHKGRDLSQGYSQAKSAVFKINPTIGFHQQGQKTPLNTCQTLFKNSTRWVI